MNTQLRHYLAGAPHLYPYALELAFPRIVSQLVAAWPSRAEASALFKDLLIDGRGDRQGFPPAVGRELINLSVSYEDLVTNTEVPPSVAQPEYAITSAKDLGTPLTPTDLREAAQSGDTRRLLIGLRAGMPVDARDARDWTPLMIAAFHGRDGIARSLIENGADPRAGDRGGYTALHWAALNGHDAVVAVLSHAVDCNLRSTSGFTPLIQAATRGHIAVVKLLLRAGADPNLATRDGSTPLHRAVANRHHAIVRLLIGAGASPFARYANGTTPLSLALSRNDDLTQLLWLAGSDASQRTARASSRTVQPATFESRHSGVEVGACNRSLPYRRYSG